MTSFRSVAFFFGALVVGCGSNAELVGGDSGDPVVSTGGSSGAGGTSTTSTGTGVINLGDSAIVDPFDDCDGGACPEAAPPPPMVCGDGKINQVDEKCDDGNTESGDGCTANCQQVEADFACPTPGSPCVSTVKCGDGKISPGTETCDDGNANAKDGCDATCKTEPGWDCEVAGELCVPHCGDGMIVGDEECEFYNGATPTAGAGCGIDCRIEPGWDCNATAKTCAKTVCGNKMVERGESCDDANNVPFDGCLNCQAEPSCTAGTCMAVCGDGKRYNSEDCDDGNIRDGDGCSHDCKIEMGYKCTDVVPAAADKITLPVIFRDFMGDIKNDEQSTRNSAALVAARTAAGVMLHPDFNHFNGGGTLGAVEQKLGTDGKPVYVVNNNPAAGNFTGKTNFDMWYRTDARLQPDGHRQRRLDPQRPRPLRVRQHHHQRLLSPRQQGVRSHPRCPCDLQQSQLQFHHRDSILVRVRRWREVRFLGRRRRLGLRERHFGHRLGRPAPQARGRLYARSHHGSRPRCRRPVQRRHRSQADERRGLRDRHVPRRTPRVRIQLQAHAQRLQQAEEPMRPGLR